MPKIIDRRGRVRPGKVRELYDDGDSEQREGMATPRNELMREAVLGKKDSEATERPASMANNRPQPPGTRSRS